MKRKPIDNLALSPGAMVGYFALLAVIFMAAPKNTSFADSLSEGNMVAAREHIEYVRGKQWCERLAWGNSEFIQSLTYRHHRMAVAYNLAAAEIGYEPVDDSLSIRPVPQRDAVYGIQLSKINFYAECKNDYGIVPKWEL